jgi:DNA-binding NtrC family response regulator
MAVTVARSADKQIVLVVEDEPMLLLMAIDVVEDAGYEAVHASNADEAVAILEKRTDIRLVFTDVDMPGSMDGMKLAAAIRGRWPPIEIIIVSGHRTVDLAALPARSRFFQKPYNTAEIIKAMRDMAT